MSADLLPCPFCGGAPALTFYRDMMKDEGPQPAGWWEVCCLACTGNVEFGAWDEASVIAAWNTRAGMKDPEAEIARLREAVATIVEWYFGGCPPPTPTAVHAAFGALAAMEPTP
jgi:Lar family restriction alleviation protein